MALVGAAATTASHFEQALRRFYQSPVSAAPVLAALDHRPPIAAPPNVSCFTPNRSRICKSWCLGGAATGRELYQPFRPPVVVPSENGLSVDEQLEILREQRGQWHDYGKMIPNLMRAGFTPSMLDEATGLTGVEQNQIVVASQVRDTLASGGMDEDSLAYFDAGGSAILYELRILSAQQRKSTAEFVIERKMDAKGARDLARAVKDFDRRKREFGWELFSSGPGDRLAFWWYRQSREFKDGTEQEAALRKGLEFATTENAHSMLKRALGKPEEPATTKDEKRVDLCVVRLELGETAGMVMLPVADPDEQSIREAPTGGALGEGRFRIHRSQSAWKGWVPLPGWQPILEAVSPITILFPDTRIISSQNEKDAAKEEEMLLVVDKGKLHEIKPELVYLVGSAEGLRLQSGTEVSKGEALGEVLMALWPPRHVKEVETEEDWD